MSIGRAYVDGSFVPLSEARVPVLDRGFLYADSCFETVRTYGGRPFLLGDHLDRLRCSGRSLWLPIPWSDEGLTGIVARLLRELGAEGEAMVRIAVTRGAGGTGLSFPEPQDPRLVVIARPVSVLPASVYEEGVWVSVPEHHEGKRGDVPAHVKSGSYLANVLALREARAKGSFDALLRGADGTWSEGTTANLFVVRAGHASTPGLRQDILPGITRALVLATAREAGLEVEEGPVGDAALFGADELFLTSSIKEIVPVVRLEGKALGDGRPGPVTRRIQVLFRAGVERINAAGGTRIGDVFPEHPLKLPFVEEPSE